MRQRIKITAAALLLLTLLLSAGITASAASGHSILIDGELAKLENPVLLFEGYNFAPMGEIMAILGAEVSWNANTKTATALREDNEISVEIGAKEAIVNGERLAIDAPARIVEGRTYVPIGFVGRALGYTVEYDADAKRVTLKTPAVNKGGLSVDFEPRYDSELDFDEAYKRALSQSNSLKDLAASLKFYEESSNETKKKYDLYGAQNYVPQIDTSTTILSMISAIEKQETQIKNEPYQRKQIEEGLGLSIKAGLLDIIDAQQSIANGEATLELAKMGLEHTKLAYELGVNSETDYENASRSYEQQRENQGALERSLEEKFLNLNKLLGYDANKRYNVVVEDEYVPMSEGFLLENYITTSVDAAPTVKIAENNLQLAEREKELYTGDSHSGFEQAKAAVESASRNVEETRKTLEKNIRTGYKGLKDLEASITTAELDLAKLRTAAETAKVNYDAGNITELKLLEAYLAADKAEKAIELTKLLYSIRRYNFARPYLY